MDFKKAFQERGNDIDDETGLWRQFIDLEAPSGTHYEKITDGTYHLVSDKDSSFQMSVIQSFPNEWKDLGAKSPEDFWKLFYRNQKPIEINIEKYEVAGQEVTPDKLIQDFNSKLEGEQIAYIKPIEFNPIPDIPVLFNGNKYFLKIERKPLLSLTESLFETVDDGIFHLKIFINEETSRMNINLTHNLSKAKNLENLVKHKSMILDYYKGPIKIFGQVIPNPYEDNAEDIEKYMEFCTKLIDISKYFNIEFDITKDVTAAEAYNCFRIHASFIEDSFYLLPDDVHTKFSFAPNQEEEQLRKTRKNLSTNTTMMIFGYENPTIEILGQEIPCIEMYVFPEAQYSHEEIIDGKPSFIFKIPGEGNKYRRLMSNIIEKPDANLIAKQIRNKVIQIPIL